VRIVLNKTDLGLEDTQYLIDAYTAIGIDLVLTSAIEDDGMADLLPILNQDDMHTVAFAGVSGVGKSSLLNRLIPSAQQRTGEVSRKTGKGTQTTSMSQGYLYKRAAKDDLLLVDLPGIQNFGVSNLTPRQVVEGYTEFVSISHLCEYADCQHTVEPHCAVQAALEEGIICPTRYLSYIGILDEIEAARPY
jgi:ribosome biogenesis GTPase